MNIFGVDEAKFLSQLKVKVLSQELKLDWGIADQFFQLMDQVKDKYNIQSEVTFLT